MKFSLSITFTLAILLLIVSFSPYPLRAQESTTTKEQNGALGGLVEDLFSPLRNPVFFNATTTPIATTTPQNTATTSDTTVIIERNKEETSPVKPQEKAPTKKEIKKQVEEKEQKKETPTSKDTVTPKDEKSQATSTQPTTTQPIVILSTNSNKTTNPYEIVGPLSPETTIVLLSFSIVSTLAGLLLAQGTLLERAAYFLSYQSSRNRMPLEPRRGRL